MNTRDFANAMATLGAELALGVPAGARANYMLNLGDPSIVAPVEHLRYGVSLLNQWLAGAEAPWVGADWTASWKKGVVTEGEWRALRDDLRRELTAWMDGPRAPRELNERELGSLMGSIAHLGYHFGAIRQIDRAARGPTAEDEARAKAAR